MTYGEGHAPLRERRSVAVAYLLWCASLFGVAGLHRFYLRRWATGALWFFTVGLCYVGSVIDLFLIPEMVRSFNESAGAGGNWPRIGSAPPPMTLDQALLALARKRGSRGFTFNDAVLELGYSPDRIRPQLEQLMQADCLLVTNDVEGRVIYREP